MSEKPTLIIGAGVAGLCCAIHLQRAGRSVRVLEGSDSVGGRVRTDKVEGFLLDRGFQVFLTEYPEARRMLRLRGLQLKAFYPGARIRWCGKFHTLADPYRKPHRILETLRNPTATFKDGFLLTQWRTQLASQSLHTLFNKPEKRALDHLQEMGFSAKFVDAFLRPFFAGVFLDPQLETSSRMLEFTYQMFATGRATLPSQGIQAIPEQLTRELSRGTVHFESRVRSLQPQSVELESGETLAAENIVLATDAPEAYRLLGRSDSPVFQSTYCLYFTMPKFPLDDIPLLVLNGDGHGPINNLVLNSRVSRSYAPEGQELLSVTVLQRFEDHAQLEQAVRDQLHDWFGAEATEWRLLRIYDIPQALPQQRPPALQFSEKGVKVSQNLFVCGDHREHASLQGAMRSGRRAAHAILTEL
jgi:phytoene dehydrogenase-like protein